jgi:hypothetical protein
MAAAIWAGAACTRVGVELPVARVTGKAVGTETSKGRNAALFSR